MKFSLTTKKIYFHLAYRKYNFQDINDFEEVSLGKDICSNYTYLKYIFCYLVNFIFVQLFM